MFKLKLFRVGRKSRMTEPGHGRAMPHSRNLNANVGNTPITWLMRRSPEGYFLPLSPVLRHSIYLHLIRIELLLSHLAKVSPCLQRPGVYEPTTAVVAERYDGRARISRIVLRPRYTTAQAFSLR